MEYLPSPSLQEHLPAIGEVVRPGEIDAPLGRERHGPVEGDDLAGIGSRQVARVPDAGSVEQSHPDLLVLEPDLGAGDDAPVALAVECDLHVLFPALEDAHGDRVAVSDEVEDEVLAGEIGPSRGGAEWRRA